MKRMCALIAMLWVVFVFCPSPGSAQSEEERIAIYHESEQLRTKARSNEDLEKAIEKYQQAIQIFERKRSDESKGTILHLNGEFNECEDLHLHVLEGKSDEILPSNRDPSGNIAISLTSDKSIASAGEQLSFTATVDRGCRLTVTYVSESGRVTVLWPNRESGWNALARADSPIRIPSPESRFKLQVDGKQPYETIVAYATSDGKDILNEGQLRDIPGTDFRMFAGTSADLAELFHDRLKDTANGVSWGTAQLNVRVSSPEGSTAENGADAKADAKGWGLVAIRASNGKYLSLRRGKTSWAPKVGTSETFRLQPAAIDQVRIVGRYGSIKEFVDFKTNMFIAIRVPHSEETATGDASEKKLVANSPRASRTVVLMLYPVKRSAGSKRDALESDETEDVESSTEEELSRE